MYILLLNRVGTNCYEMDVKTIRFHFYKIIALRANKVKELSVYEQRREEEGSIG